MLCATVGELQSSTKETITRNSTFVFPVFFVPSAIPTLVCYKLLSFIICNTFVILINILFCVHHHKMSRLKFKIRFHYLDIDVTTK